MAKPIRISGLPRRSALPRAAAWVLAPMLADVLSREPAARAGEVEAGIHDMRVAMKRFREAFRLFAPAFRKKTVRRHSRWVERLNDALGEVRDRDVMEVRLAELAKVIQAPPPGLAILVIRLQSERQAQWDHLADLLDSIHEEHEPDRLAAEISALETIPTWPEDSRVLDFARDAIQSRLWRVRRRWDAVRRETTPQSLHRVRIANKRLRYAIEPFGRWFGAEVRLLHRLTERLHDALGDLHDDDVLLPMLENGMARTPAAEHAAWSRLVAIVQRRRRRHLRRTMKVAERLHAGVWEKADGALLAMAQVANPAATPDIESC